MQMNLHKINKQLRKSALESSNNFVNSYLQYEDQIINELKKQTGIKSELFLNEVDNEFEEMIRFSSLFSDLTIINNTPSSIKDTHITINRPESKYFQDIEVTFPAAEFKIFPPEAFELTPCYIHRSDEEVKKISKDLSYLMNSNRLLARPLRGVYAHNKITNENILHFANPNTERNHWFVDNVNNQEYFYIDNGLNFSQVGKLFELTLPYFANIKLKVLDKILHDEANLLSGFRSNLKAVIKESAENLKSIKELQQDLLNPEIDKINRRFKKIQGLHRMSVGGSVGAFALSVLFGVYQGTDLMKLLSTFLPSGGLIASEIKFRDEIDRLKDNPYYLLWRVNRKK